MDATAFHRLALAAALLALTGCAVTGAPALNPVEIETVAAPAAELVSGGQARAVIVIPERRQDHDYVNQPYVPEGRGELYQLGIAGMAAQELRRAVAESTGVELQVITADMPLPLDKNLILVGASRATAAFGLDSGRIPDEGFRVEVFPRGVAIIGAPPRQSQEGGLAYNGLYSTLFGAYDFLERFVGARFYYPGPDGVVAPKLSRLVIPPVKYVDYPRYEKRQMIPWDATGLEGKPDFTLQALRYRSGGHGKFGANATWNHTPWNLAANPACPRSLDADGKPRQTTPPMPCYGNPETSRRLLACYDDVLGHRGDMTEWRTTSGGQFFGLPNSGILPFSPPDHPVSCSCANCRALLDPAAPFTSQASPLMGDFVKRLAEAVKAKWPGQTLFWLPYYNYTAAPRGLKLPDNVFAQVCLMYGNSLYGDPRVQQPTKEWIHGWSQATGRPVHVYTYPMWPTLDSPFPYQFPHELRRFTRDFRGEVNGAFLCGPGDGDNAGLRGGLWAYQMPTVYCWFRLMWNPDFNVDAALEEMPRLLYGPAAEPMGRVLAALTNAWEKQDSSKLKDITALGPYHPGSIGKEELYRQTLTPELVKGLRDDLDAAVKATAPGSVFRRRVDLLGDTLRLFFQDYDNFIKGNTGPEPVAAAAYLATAPTLDGKLDEPFWKELQPHYLVNAHLTHARQPPVATMVKLARDAQGLLLGFRMEEPEMGKAVIKPHVFEGNSLEILLSPAPGCVYQFILDSQGNVQDGFRGPPPARREGHPSYKVDVAGDHWTAEVFIPFTALGTDAPSSWRANFIRNRVVSGLPKHVSRWHTRFDKSNFDPNAFAEIKFARR